MRQLSDVYLSDNTSVVFRLLVAPSRGMLVRNHTEIEPGDEFVLADVARRLISYQHLGGDEATEDRAVLQVFTLFESLCEKVSDFLLYLKCLCEEPQLTKCSSAKVGGFTAKHTA